MEVPAHFFRVLQMLVRKHNPCGAPCREGKSPDTSTSVSVRRRLGPRGVKRLSWLLPTWTSCTALHATVQKQFVSHYTLCRELINPFRSLSMCFLSAWGAPCSWMGLRAQDAGTSVPLNKETRGTMEQERGRLCRKNNESASLTRQSAEKQDYRKARLLWCFSLVAPQGWRGRGVCDSCHLLGCSKVAVNRCFCCKWLYTEAPVEVWLRYVLFSVQFSK